MLLIIMGQKKGLILSTPFSRATTCSRSRVVIPPMPEPMMIPSLSGFTTPASPESSYASRAAMSANCVYLSVRLTSFGSM